MLEYYDTSEKVLISIFCSMVTVILITTIYVIIKNKLSHFMYKFLFVVLIVGIIFNILFIVSIFFPFLNLGKLIELFSSILLPFLWFFIALGITFYGGNAIVTRKTYVRFPTLFFSRKAEGLEAIYFGVSWVIAGFMMLIIEMIVIGFVLCNDSQWFCPIFKESDRVYSNIKMNGCV
jgi:hypothetical protein